MNTIPVICSKDCGAGCPLTAVITDGCIAQITDNPLKGDYMLGCPKGYQMHTALDHPDRLRHPLIRTGARGSGRFRRANWDEALQRIAEHIGRRQNGLDGGLPSIMRIGGSGSCRSLVQNTGSLAKRFLSAVGASSSGTYTDTLGNYSSEAADFMKPHLFGPGKNDFGIDPRTLLQSEALILLGLNPGDTRFGCRTEQVLAEVKRKGTPVIIIDPRKTRSVRLYASQWIPIRPGTDSVLLSALLYEVLKYSGSSRISSRKGQNSERHIERICNDFNLIREYVLGSADGLVKTPEWAAPICGIDSRTIRRLVELMMEKRPAALLPGLSVQRTLGGEETDRLGLALQILLGNIGVAGGCRLQNYMR